MQLNVGEVARLSGVTARTLRHYDEIGLLQADRDPASGYRVYTRQHLFRLQRILLLRGLGLSLPRIAEIFSGEMDDVAALRHHLEALEAEMDRMKRLLHTVRRTVAAFDEGDAPDIDWLFDGFQQRHDALEARLVTAFGPQVRQHFDSAARVTTRWLAGDHLDAIQAGRELLQRLSRLREQGVHPGDESVAPLLAEHQEAIRTFWPIDDAAYSALADLLVDDPQQRAFLDAIDPHLAPWLRDSIKAHRQSD